MIWSLIGCILISTGKIDVETPESQEDNDCEKSIVYADLDGDGFGGEEFNLCDTEGYISIGGDCDDNNTEVHPAATEVCDEMDNDCDQLIDDDDNDLVTQQPVYEDVDGDGYGSSQEYYFCDSPDGYVNNSNDCDDNDETSTYKLIDNDCDGSLNELGCISISIDRKNDPDSSELVGRFVVFEDKDSQDDSALIPSAYLNLENDSEVCSSSADTLTLQYHTFQYGSEIDFTLYRTSTDGNYTEVLGQGVTYIQAGIYFEDEYYFDGIDVLVIGVDCDDTDENILDMANDLDCDGVLGIDDCNDQDASSAAISEDHDCDGLSNAQDTVYNGSYSIDGTDSQTQLERIQSYEEIEGDLHIDQSTLTDIPLNNLISVNNIVITENNELEEITGFNALTQVDDVVISSNDNLISLQGFSSLEQIDGMLQFTYNDGLEQITFPSLTYIYQLWLLYNPSLTIEQVSFLQPGSNVSVGSCFSALGWCPEDCNNGVDDDSDGYTDCADSECENVAACQNSNDQTE